MDRLVVEVMQQGHRQYYKVNTFPFSIGRGYNNDLILWDRSVSEQHLIIDKNESNELILIDLDSDNGSTLDGVRIEQRSDAIATPASLFLGYCKINLFSADTPVEPTIVPECKGIMCVFHSILGAIVLLLITCGAFILKIYLNSGSNLGFGEYINELSKPLLFMILFFLIISGVSRLSTYRWNLSASLVIASLLFLIPQVIDHVGHFLNYYFVTDNIRYIAIMLSNFILLPLLLVIFMIKVAQTRVKAALGVALLVSSPVIFIQIQEYMKKIDHSKFSKYPVYSKTLSAYDIRRGKSLDFISFLNNANTVISEKVAKELVRSKKND